MSIRFAVNCPSLKGSAALRHFRMRLLGICGGGNADASKKRKQRAALLSKAGIDLSKLTNMDLLDAALCALAAYHLAIGRECVSYGEQESGLIIVPK